MLYETHRSTQTLTHSTLSAYFCMCFALSSRSCLITVHPLENELILYKALCFQFFTVQFVLIPQHCFACKRSLLCIPALLSLHTFGILVHDSHTSMRSSPNYQQSFFITLNFFHSMHTPRHCFSAHLFPMQTQAQYKCMVRLNIIQIHSSLF